ncbi:hypothetical protein SMACR_06885 [Sordaria macrospora]|uniref:WGS project CABT00000000 data, contig 2.38 n=2 Tax=Sordaria macrospora TaxID=5147 RepID=F7W796_SORMK|nr:uncharacterized protein SMAC_06885 [Sordaria macrospora k-hell]KAA8633648.1 hypothetical protein SMACR_06885 [Sordaria macrospora]KAH7634056.1 hypothetical protein B0T09DRAFT_258684 [Sordaria sp. MPI-SDFR-AT-0083]WPJ59590.1 hypothetical protein SMAC4_06885 [Sordaria macrospora]CCC13387.1 unnamed protein product [Sordaria macrospora k-hell]
MGFPSSSSLRRPCDERMEQAPSGSDTPLVPKEAPCLGSFPASNLQRSGGTIKLKKRNKKAKENACSTRSSNQAQERRQKSGKAEADDSGHLRQSDQPALHHSLLGYRINYSADSVSPKASISCLPIAFPSTAGHAYRKERAKLNASWPSPRKSLPTGDILIAEVSSSTLATVRDKMGPGAGGAVSAAAAAAAVVVKTDDSDDRWTDERGLLSRGTWKRREGTSGE